MAYGSTPRAGKLALAALLPLLAASNGCAPLASVTYCQPAAVDVRGLRQVAVAEFTGAGGDLAAAAAHHRLAENRFYHVVDPAQISPLRQASVTQIDEECLLGQARASGVDAVLMGEVRAYRCDDEMLADAENSAGAGLSAAELSRDWLTLDFKHRGRIRRNAEVAIAFRLVDARTGEVRASRECSRTYNKLVRPDDESGPGRVDVLNELVDGCVQDFVDQLAPHENQCLMSLARGEWLRPGCLEVRKGNKAAIAGDWAAARQHWEVALELNPDCDSALYNLAIDAANHQQYSDAEDFAMQALRIEHCELYTDGLARIRSHRSDFESSIEQRDNRILQAAASPW